MPNATKLYTLDTGTWTHDYSLLVRLTDVGREYETPLPCYLIDHPEGVILAETGINPELPKDPENYGPYGAPELAELLETLEITEEQHLFNQLEKCGYAPEDIDYVVLSHLHLDHAGYISELPDATYIVQQDELQWAFYPSDPFQRRLHQLGDLAPLRSPEYDVQPIEGEYDLFGDGSIVCLPTPGHTPGSQALMVTLEETGTVILAADLAHTEYGLDNNTVPPFNWSTEESIRSIRRVKNRARREDAEIILQHDVDHFERMPKPPEALE
jgi:N-acyl homoserine lactone hydrolase